MPTFSIKKYWERIDSSSYHLISHNCSTVVANALLTGFLDYVNRLNEIKKWIKMVRIFGADVAKQILLGWLPFNLGELLGATWTPGKVKKLAKDLKEVMY